jgi:hypothetical protein
MSQQATMLFPEGTARPVASEDKMRRKQTMNLILFFFVMLVTVTMQAAKFTIDQTLSDEAQRTTIAFDGLAFLTGDLCSDSFIPPGKVADFFGFQYLRDNDPDEMGHNTDFLTRISNNVLYILTDSQVAELATLAKTQVAQINEYGYKRFPLIKAFRRQFQGDIPEGSSGLDLEAVKTYSAELYQLDGLISYQRAEVIGAILRNLTANQIAYLEGLASSGMLSWPEVGDQIDKRNYSHDEHVAIMTFASQLFSWYAGSTEADTYFCPERQGTYFGSFYLKDMPAMGNPNYSIDPNLTANKGKAFLAVLDDAQAQLITDLVDIQRSDLLEIVDVRKAISVQLRRLMTESAIDRDTLLDLAHRYGELDGQIVCYFASHFARVGNSLASSQQSALMTLRDLDHYPCSGAYLYSENISLPEIIDTDFLFSSGEGGGGFIGTDPFGEFSTPIDGSVVRSSVPVTGWALDDVGIESVKIYRQEGNTLVFIGDAVMVEGVRPDIEVAYPGYPDNHRAGWGYMLLTNFLPNNGNGMFTLHAIATDKEGNEVTLGTKTITCDNASAVKPFGAIDTPEQGGIASGTLYRNQGWVLTPMPNSMAVDGSGITVYIDGKQMGHPTYNIYRPDIASLFPDYANSSGALAYFDFDTTQLENGVHTIAWSATDNANNTDGIGSRYFTVQNSGNSRTKQRSYNQASRETHSYLLLDDLSGFKTRTIKRRIKEMERFELNLLSIPLNSIDGYQIVGQQLRPLPPGSSLDPKSGKWYWSPGFGFFGDYRFVFVIKDVNGNLHNQYLKIKIEPKF